MNHDRSAGGNDGGQIIPMAAILFVGLLVIATFAVETLMWYTRAAELQKLADVAALAGADTRADGATDQQVTDLIDSILTTNGFNAAEMNRSIDLSVPDDVTVDVSDPRVVQFISQLFSRPISITRSATATAGGCVGVCDHPIVIDAPYDVFAQGGSGDGFTPILADGGRRFLTMNHHRWYGNLLVCVDIENKASCPGYPAWVESSTSDVPGLVVFDEYDEVWSTRRFYDKAADTTTGGLECHRISTGADCGFIYESFTVDGDLGSLNSQSQSEPARYGSRVFFIDDPLNVHCYDVSVHQPCPGYPRSIPAWNALDADDLIGSGPDVTNSVAYELVLGSRLYLNWPAESGRYLLCWDMEAANPCPNFNAPKLMMSAYPYIAVLVDVDENLAPVGVCLYASGIPCVDLDGSTYNRADLTLAPYRYQFIASPTRVGSRLYVSSYQHDDLVCFDTLTNKTCGRIAGRGWQPYGVVLGNNDCLVGYGHTGVVFMVDLNLNPCGGGTGQLLLNPCTCADGTNQYYGNLAIDAAFLAEFTSFEVTIVGPAEQVLIGPVDLTTTGGRLDLSAIDPAIAPIEMRYDGTLAGHVDLEKNPLVGTVTLERRAVLRE